MNDLDRTKGIGGSDAAAALGMSPWKTPYQLWLEKRGEGEQEIDTEFGYWGNALEAPILNRFERDAPAEVLCRQQLFVSPEHPFMFCHVDGIAGDDLVQAKTYIGSPWDEVPDQYQIQVQHEMICTGAKLCHMPVLFSYNTYKCYTIEADPKLQALIIEGERRFWELVQSNTPPEPVNLPDTRHRFRAAVSAEVEATDDIAMKVASIKTVKERIKAFKAEESLLLKEVMSYMRENDVLTYDGAVLATWKQAKGATLFDAEAFQAAHPDLAAEFTKQGEPTRRFLAK